VAYSVSGEELVFVSIDELVQGQSDSVADADAAKPVDGVPDHPFHDSVFEKCSLVDEMALFLQPKNLISQQLGLNPGVNLTRIIADREPWAIDIHSQSFKNTSYQSRR